MQNDIIKMQYEMGFCHIDVLMNSFARQKLSKSYLQLLFLDKKNNPNLQLSCSYYK